MRSSMSCEFMRYHKARDRPSKEPALAKIAEIAPGRILNHIGGKLEKTDLPPFIDAVDDRAARIFGSIDQLPEAVEDIRNGIVHDILRHIRLAKLETVFKDGEMMGMILKPFNKGLGALAEALEQGAMVMPGCDDLRAFGVKTAIADANFIRRIHQFRDEVKTEARIAEGGDALLRREDHLSIIDGVLKGILVEH